MAGNRHLGLWEKCVKTRFPRQESPSVSSVLLPVICFRILLMFPGCNNGETLADYPVFSGGRRDDID